VTEGTVDSAELTVGEGGFGYSIAVSVGHLAEGRRGVCYGLLCCSLVGLVCRIHSEVGSIKPCLNTVTDKLDIVKVYGTRIIVVITVYGYIVNGFVLTLRELYRRELPFLGARKNSRIFNVRLKTFNMFFSMKDT